MDKKSCINSAPFQPQPPPTHTAADRMPCGCVSGQIPLGESLRIFPQSMYFHFIKTCICFDIHYGYIHIQCPKQNHAINGYECFILKIVCIMGLDTH